MRLKRASRNKHRITFVLITQRTLHLPPSARKRRAPLRPTEPASQKINHYAIHFSSTSRRASRQTRRILLVSPRNTVIRFPETPHVYFYSGGNRFAVTSSREACAPSRDGRRASAAQRRSSQVTISVTLVLSNLRCKSSCFGSPTLRRVSDLFSWKSMERFEAIWSMGPVPVLLHLQPPQPPFSDQTPFIATYVTHGGIWLGAI